MKPDSQISVLFVCLGNICRSPMAEAIFRHLVKEEGLQERVVCDSCGTGGWHAGEPPHQGTQDVLARNNISTKGLVARQITTKDLSMHPFIIAMDRSNAREIAKLSRLHGININEIKLLLEFCQLDTDEVPDPYYTGEFDRVYDLVHQGCTSLLDYIKRSL